MQRRTMMAGLTACLVATGTLAISALLATPADAWSRKGAVTGPRGGTTTWERSGSCEGGTCTRSKSVTGPAGNTRSLDKSRTCTGGSCTIESTYTAARQ